MSGSKLNKQGKYFGKDETMLRWAFIFLIVALIAALFGFTEIAVAATGIAKILFFFFLVLFVLALVSGLIHHPRI
jgi:uncharacterized membrane protein YtjA (UPF0391 family)